MKYRLISPIKSLINPIYMEYLKEDEKAISIIHIVATLLAAFLLAIVALGAALFITV